MATALSVCIEICVLLNEASFPMAVVLQATADLLLAVPSARARMDMVV